MEKIFNGFVPCCAIAKFVVQFYMPEKCRGIVENSRTRPASFYMAINSIGQMSIENSEGNAFFSDRTIDK
jgi:hypothetical protein